MPPPKSKTSDALPEDPNSLDAQVIMCTATNVQPNNNSPTTFSESRISVRNAVC